MTPYERGKALAAKVIGTSVESDWRRLYNIMGKKAWEAAAIVGSQMDFKWTPRDAAEYARGQLEILEPRFR